MKIVPRVVERKSGRGKYETVNPNGSLPFLKNFLQSLWLVQVFTARSTETEIVNDIYVVAALYELTAYP